MFTVTIVRAGFAQVSVECNAPKSVSEILRQAELSAQGHEIRVNGTITTNTETVIQNDATIRLLKQTAGA